MDKTDHSKRYHFVDSIRGIAALGVVYLHVSTMTLASAGAMEAAFLLPFRQWLDTGKAGVALFFLVSGFVVPFSLKGDRVTGFAKFCVSRFFRLYPLYWFSILATLAAIYLIHKPWPPLKVIAVNVTMLQQFVGVPDLQQLYWTLQIEIIFYVLCAALFVAGSLSRPKILAVSSAAFLALALLAAAARFYLDKKIPVAVPVALCLMFLGTLWRKHLLEQSKESGKYAKALAALFLVFIPVISLLAYNKDMGFHESWYRYTISYSVALIAFLLLTTVMKIRGRVPVFLGRISYSLYLMRGPLLFLYQKFALPHLAHFPVHGHILLVSLIDIAVSYVTFTLIEQPAVEIGKRVAVAISNAVSSAVPHLRGRDLSLHR